MVEVECGTFRVREIYFKSDDYRPFPRYRKSRSRPTDTFKTFLVQAKTLCIEDSKLFLKLYSSYHQSRYHQSRGFHFLKLFTLKFNNFKLLN